MKKIDKLAAALDRFEHVMKEADEKLSTMRNLRYKRIFENQKRFMELDAQNKALIQQVQNPAPAVPTVKIS